LTGAVGRPPWSLGAIAPVAVLQYKKWGQYENGHWKILRDRYYGEGLFPMLDEVTAAIAMIPGVEEAEISALNEHRVVLVRQKIIEGIKGRYAMRKGKLEHAERILQEDT
jgi:hypothetical protein